MTIQEPTLALHMCEALLQIRENFTSNTLRQSKTWYEDMVKMIDDAYRIADKVEAAEADARALLEHEHTGKQEYYILTKELVNLEYRPRANSKEEAIELVKDGEVDGEIIEFLDEDTEIVSVETDKDNAKDRLEYLRTQIENECINYGEIAELQSLSQYIDKSDVLLLERAGIEENISTAPATLDDDRIPDDVLFDSQSNDD